MFYFSKVYFSHNPVTSGPGHLENIILAKYWKFGQTKKLATNKKYYQEARYFALKSKKYEKSEARKRGKSNS